MREYSLPPDIVQEKGLFGIVGRTLTASCALALGRVLGTYKLRARRHVLLVARDNRISSIRLTDELIRGLVLSGIQVLHLSAVPLPVLFFAMSVLKISDSVMVTGCDESMICNGFKIFLNDAPASRETLELLIKASSNRDWVNGSGRVIETEVQAAYVKSITENNFFLFKNVSIGILWVAFPVPLLCL